MIEKINISYTAISFPKPEIKFRWQEGPQIGYREATDFFAVDVQGKRHDISTVRTPWVWRNWRFKVVEGSTEPMDVSMVFEIRPSVHQGPNQQPRYETTQTIVYTPDQIDKITQ